MGNMLEIYEPQINGYLTLAQKPTPAMASAVMGIIDSLGEMPYCIYDVLHARMLLNVNHDKKDFDGEVRRMGVPVDRLIHRMKRISDQIKSKKEKEYYGQQSED